jgi:hypothetical protein
VESFFHNLGKVVPSTLEGSCGSGNTARLLWLGDQPAWDASHVLVDIADRIVDEVRVACRRIGDTLRLDQILPTSPSIPSHCSHCFLATPPPKYKTTRASDQGALVESPGPVVMTGLTRMTDLTPRSCRDRCR